MDRFKAGIKEAVGAIPKDKGAALDVKDQFAGHLEKYPSLAKLEELTNRKREEVVGAILLGLFGLLILGVFIKPLGIFMTRLFGFAYPAYKSFKAIESTEKGDDTQWLTYWMIFAVFSLAEETALRPLEAYAPFFFAWKIVFLLWCYLPQTKGADLLYTEVVGPQMKKLGEFVEEKLVKKKED